jgi:PAS domain S-box-containing protein
VTAQRGTSDDTVLVAHGADEAGQAEQLAAARAALAASEQRLREFYRRAPIPIHSIGPNGRLLDVSDEWLAFTGYRRDEVIGRSLAEFLVPDSAERYLTQAVPELMRDVPPGETRSVEYRLLKRSGDVADIVLTARPERDPLTGAFLRSLTVMTDVTARNRAEAALRQTQKLDALGRLTGGVAHDFNNLLMAILGNLDLLRRRLPTGDPLVSRLLDSAAQGAARGASLTRRLLAFARQQDLKPDAVDVPALIEDVGEMLAPVLGPTVRLERALPPDLWRPHVDADQLGLALVNLAVNARDAMPDGGTFRIAARNHSATSSDLLTRDLALAGGEYVLIAASDTGTGMDAATLTRATEPFFTTKGVGKGTGLGLSMVHGFVGQSGGAMRLTSAPGQGTTVELWLPRATGAAPRDSDPGAHLPPHLNAAPARLRILLVDDDELVRAGTAMMLEELGHAVVAEAGSGREALAALREHVAVNVLMTDQAMPGMNGLELIAQARALRPGLRALLATGYAELGTLHAGDIPRLPKPYGLDDLRRALRDVSA